MRDTLSYELGNNEDGERRAEREAPTLLLDEVIEFLDRYGTFLSFGCNTWLNGKNSRWCGHTRGYIVIRVDGYVVRELDLVDCLEDGEPLADCGDSYCLEGLWIEHAENVARDVVLWIGRGELHNGGATGWVPLIWCSYCGNPRAENHW